MRYNVQNIVTFVVTVAILFFYIVCLILIENSNESIVNRDSERGLWSLPPSVLKALTGEFRGIVADLLVLEAGARVGTKIERNSDGEIVEVAADYNTRTIYHMLSASQSLDPTFQQTFMLAQGWLPWEGLVNETIEILKIAQDNRPWDFYLPRFRAFDTYYFLGNYTEAGEILLEAANQKNAPTYLGVLGARLCHKGGDTKAAIGLMQSVMEAKEPDEPGYQELQQRMKALQGALILEQATEIYHQRFLAWPAHPEQLVETGILSQLPNNPYNIPYCVDTFGKVFFDRPNRIAGRCYLKKKL